MPLIDPMTSLLLEFLNPFSSSYCRPSSTDRHRVHSVKEDKELPPIPGAKRNASKKSGSRPLSSLRNLSKRFKSMLHTGDNSEEPVNIDPPNASSSTADADTTRECLPLPNLAVTSNEIDTTAGVSDRPQEEPSSTHDRAEPSYILLQKGRYESISTWVDQVWKEYAKPDRERDCRRWTENQRVVEWRRYRSRCRLAKSRIGSSDRHEFLVLKLRGKSEAETLFLRFERYVRDRSIDCATHENYRPLYWQRWYTDDRVTMLDEWPDKRGYIQCEEQVFHQKTHQPSFMDLLIVVQVIIHAAWTDFETRHDHWFAVLFGRMLNGKMEKTHDFRQPIALGVAEKYGKNRGWDWFRLSTRRERRKIVELIHLCSVIRHEENIRLNQHHPDTVEGPQAGEQNPEGAPRAEGAPAAEGPGAEAGPAAEGGLGAEGLPEAEGKPGAEEGPGVEAGPRAEAGPGAEAVTVVEAVPGVEGGPVAEGKPGAEGAHGAEGAPGAEKGPVAEGVPGVEGGPEAEKGPEAEGAPKKGKDNEGETTV